MLLHPTILRFDSLPSTNTEATRQAASGAPEGLCIVAREQTEGRGRQGRGWASPPDAGLYFSIVLRPRLEMEKWPLLSLIAAIAVSDALREACRIDSDIKWPNDIHAGGRKLCGILAETVDSPQSRAAVLGIGINLTNAALPEEVRAVATSVEELIGTKPDAETILGALLNALDECYSRLHAAGGAEETLREWTRRSSYAEGKRVTVSLGAGVFEGTTRGLAEDGALRVETSNGQIKIVRAGDVTALRHAGESITN
ncbi:MAG TPA: biotin--[acetyl-CoA-carboxylase] ligase [Pyrinomonadaceae bacterium]|nr:biotin--[acetyl-CoA-carboxylase] ligase [Pyrinomonadaceae bacterium]